MGKRDLLKKNGSDGRVKDAKTIQARESHSTNHSVYTKPFCLIKYLGLERLKDLSKSS